MHPTAATIFTKACRIDPVIMSNKVICSQQKQVCIIPSNRCNFCTEEYAELNRATQSPLFTPSSYGMSMAL